jgi:putative glutamine amidotransferase
MSRLRKNRPPLIGITADLSDVSENRAQVPQEPTLFLAQRYYRAVQQAGAIAFIFPPVASQPALLSILQRLDGLLISGGNFDIHPNYYGEKPISALGTIKQGRTEFELELIDLALNQDLPLLGICGGAQAINVALGGSLYQDIATQLPSAGKHEQGGSRENGGHSVEIHSGTRLRRIVQKHALDVNTTHQGSGRRACRQCHSKRWIDRRNREPEP